MSERVGEEAFQRDQDQQSGPRPAGEAAAKGKDSHTEQGAPTDAAHQDAGDGALTGSVPAGLTRKELLEGAQTTGRDDAGVD